MFNFKVFSKAMMDSNLSDNSFRVLSFILNTMSMKKTNVMEIHRGYIMDKMKISESTVKRAFKELEKNGYIERIIIGTTNNRKGDIIKISSDLSSKMSSKMTPLYKDQISNDKSNNKKNKHSNYIGTRYQVEEVESFTTF